MDRFSRKLPKENLVKLINIVVFFAEKEKEGGDLLIYLDFLQTYFNLTILSGKTKHQLIE